MTATPNHPNAEKLAAAIRARREELGLSLHRVAGKGGPTKPTQTRYERGEIPLGTQDGTLRKYDHALDWAPGSAAAILAGEVLPLVAAREHHPPPPSPEPDSWEVSSQKLKSLNRAVQKLRAELAELTALPSEVKETVAEVTAIQADLLTDILSNETPDDSGVSVRIG